MSASSEARAFKRLRGCWISSSRMDEKDKAMSSANHSLLSVDETVGRRRGREEEKKGKKKRRKGRYGREHPKLNPSAEKESARIITCNIYVVVFVAPNLELSIPLVLFDLATALPAITPQISVTIPINRLKRCRFAVTLPSVACPNASRSVASSFAATD